MRSGRPLSLWAVLHEGLLRQLVGGRGVMRDRLEHLHLHWRRATPSIFDRAARLGLAKQSSQRAIGRIRKEM
ncbi:Scr1 family TA system antitoxin-like transcriptional regulator [Streptomyces sp. NPDC059009]|uniref:Scr1 family TA system antitoxin-like transcriptional regulator n=1 Tax=Streptomyces sp. NPDC059009 TaxID=3346694 RepID=UPI0036CA685F